MQVTQLTQSMTNESIHKPVLLNEIVEGLTNGISSEGAPILYIDGTLGGAHHALAILEALNEKTNRKIEVIAFDQDPEAVKRAEKIFAELKESNKLKGAGPLTITIKNENFRNMGNIGNMGNTTNTDASQKQKADLILLDLGFSSDELEKSGRGFTFDKDEPLVMTYNAPEKQPFTARDILNNWKEEDIANVIYAYGEEKLARRIARAIVTYRQKKKIETTDELKEIVYMAYGRRRGKIHPATKTFQALRIAVNDELNSLREGLANGYKLLKDGGKMAVISFHSLEDRIVKEFFKDKAKNDGATVSKKPIRATGDEIQENPRSRSAKLRILTKDFNKEILVKK